MFRSPHLPVREVCTCAVRQVRGGLADGKFNNGIREKQARNGDLLLHLLHSAYQSGTRDKTPIHGKPKYRSELSTSHPPHTTEICIYTTSCRYVPN